jgi:hypothetical protein
VLLALLAILGAFYRYSRTDAFRRGDLRKASFELLLMIGPFFGVHPKRPEPEPTTISTPKDDRDDPLAERARVSTPEMRDPGEERRPPQL